MPYDKKQKEYSIKYARENLKRIPLDDKKEYYDKVIEVADEKRGISVRAFILQAIEEKISHDKGRQ